jgi:outer membrane lipoprotein carrier protein
MKLFLGSLLTCNLLFGFPIELNTIESHFTQSILDEHNKSIVYEGKLWAKKPAMAHWSYEKPVQKDIYVAFSKVTIVEPDLEQVIHKDIGDTIDLIAIISHSKELTQEHYVAEYNNKDYHIYLDKNLLRSIAYRDDFGNNTVIDFDHIKQNHDLNTSYLEAVIPEDYDVIK